VWLPGPWEWPWELDPESLLLDELGDDDPESEDVDVDELEPASDLEPESDFVEVDVEDDEPLESVL
jgi:hypothetical protein